MVVNLNMEIEARLANVYKSLAEPKPAEDRKPVSPDEFWQSMRMIATNNQALSNINIKRNNNI